VQGGAGSYESNSENIGESSKERKIEFTSRKEKERRKIV